jgi:hypothetical protein
MPKRYVFLPKGNQYKTLHCRRLTHEAGKPLFLVEDCKKIIGIRIPKFVFIKVQSLFLQTLSSRSAVTERRDAALVHQAAAALDKEFPNIPSEVKESVLKHGFRKNSGRVGRTRMLSMKKRVVLAVIAHIRHQHTGYDKMLDNRIGRDEARRNISKPMHDLLKLWSAKGGKA